MPLAAMLDTNRKTMAAITAAVQAYLEEEARAAERPPRQFIAAARAWSDFGRAELMRQRVSWQLRLARPAR